LPLRVELRHGGSDHRSSALCCCTHHPPGLTGSWGFAWWAPVKQPLTLSYKLPSDFALRVLTAKTTEV